MKRMTSTVLQVDDRNGSGVFNIPYYRVLKKYMIIMGQYPTQSALVNNCCVTVLVASNISLILPTLFQMYISMRAKDFDGILECQPHLFTTAISGFKLLSLHVNKEYLRKMFVSVEEEWKLLKFNGSLCTLDDITKSGSKIAQLYRGSLLSFLSVFVMLPLVNPMLDIVMPLNETRPRQQVFKLYYFVNNDDHFFPIYFHASICSICAILMIITFDSVFMVISHHASGLFAICGDKIKKSTENNRTKIGVAEWDDGYEEARKCVAAHKKAIEFFKMLEQVTEKLYLLLIGGNMIGICVTAFQVIVHLNEPDEAIRYVVFCVAQNFHLFYISIPGQIIADRSFELGTSMYCSAWYRTSRRVQRVLGMMQLRSSKPCELIAGGVYKVNIENFGATFKTCMSYITMLLSMRE
ncbi:uncharacterized protein LOC128878119 isoform X2 [Hylaeus volcanicus]|uniref:uncharacterized protein LOC128878119 isoform X2 n=1 Tax=Hylaeus volcanicus TaxID=313075 RepID=UPI0023B7F54A|nr:uncharacterized protein LOC128878119 isoform X2 [Hylaeus volcanicus]